MPRLFFYLLLIATVASGRASEAPLRLFVLGDSISIQYGPFLEEMTAGAFAYDRKHDAGGDDKAAHNLDIPKNENGGDSAMGLAYLRARRAAGGIPADVLLLNCGLHDIKTDIASGKKQVPLDDYRNNLQDILAEAAAMHLQVVWVRTTPVIDEIHNARSNTLRRHATDVAAYNAAADAIMRAAHVPIIDLHTFTARYVPEAFADHVHYTEITRERQAAYIAGSLATLLATGTLH